MIYKFSNQIREELEAIFGLTEWQQTRFYQEVELEAAPRLLKTGLSVEQIAEALELEIEVVRKAVEKQSEES
ncbi:MAG: hypothetical protein SWZ49_31360 [Cyanobacteriota bacterium]|nr:hypothetical protein [Cyanobacteriota bacterium]